MELATGLCDLILALQRDLGFLAEVKKGFPPVPPTNKGRIAGPKRRDRNSLISSHKLTADYTSCVVVIITCKYRRPFQYARDCFNT